MSGPAATPTNPVNGEALPVFVADYVLMGYGTGAIMAVPGQDERDWEFATRFGLPIVRTVAPPEGWEGEAFTGDGPAINSANDEISLDGLGVVEAKAAHHRLAGGARAPAAAPSPTSCATGCSAGSATGASRSRSSTTSTTCPIALPDSMLPVELPEVDDYSPRTFAEDDARRPSRSRRWPARPTGST